MLTAPRPQINSTWEVWEEPVGRLRELGNAPTTYRYFEELAAAMRQAAQAALTALGDADSGSR